VNPKIAGKWMFIPLKMVLIGIDPYPYVYMVLGGYCDTHQYHLRFSPRHAMSHGFSLIPGGYHRNHRHNIQWIGFREILEETPLFNGKIYAFL